jgi:uncharacterized protein
MGPTNIALVKLFLAEREIRAAQARLDDAAKNLRIQERRVADATEKYRVSSTALKEQQAACANLELDIKTRDAHIERLRVQQQTAKNNKEYQAYLVEINTEKVEKVKVEDQTMKAMEEMEKTGAETTQLQDVLETETAKLEKVKSEIGGKLTALQAEVDALKPARDAAAAEVQPAARQAFTRLAERFDGEGLSALTKPDRRREQYACAVCNMDLVADVYNKLHSRDELFFCPSCHRILYIPDDMPPDVAVNAKPKRPVKKEATAESNG